MFQLHKRPCRSDPMFTRQHSNHTSSISGDHRAALPEAGIHVAALTDGQKPEVSVVVLIVGSLMKTASMCNSRQRWPLISALRHCPSNCCKPAQADLWDHQPPLPILLPRSPASPQTARPPSLCPMTL